MQINWVEEESYDCISYKTQSSMDNFMRGNIYPGSKRGIWDWTVLDFYDILEFMSGSETSLEAAKETVEEIIRSSKTLVLDGTQEILDQMQQDIQNARADL